jgi:hypothetical protein
MLKLKKLLKKIRIKIPRMIKIPKMIKIKAIIAMESM